MMRVRIGEFVAAFVWSRGGSPGCGRPLARSVRGRTRNRRLGPLVQHPPPPPRPGRHHATTSRRPTHNDTKGGLNKPPQNPGLDKQREGHCTRYGALHPLRATAPVTGRCTRSEGVHCLRIGCAPNHKNKRGICETIADTPPTRRRPAPHAANPHCPIQDRCTGANLDGPDGERTGRPGRGCRGCRETGK